MKISYAGCLGLSLAISAQFILIMRVAVKNREKFTKTPYLVLLRSSDTNLLSVARVCTCFGSRSFSVAAPTIWNSFLLTFAIAVQ